MGNESSQLSGLEIDEKATEVNDFWVHHQAIIRDSCRYFILKGDDSVSVFKGEAVSGPLWSTSTPLEKCSNNLLKYRHPSILRYISAWQQRSMLHLATEYVLPLSLIIGSQTPLQICIGLNNILEALVFLHDQAGLSHNNVSVPAIYVTGDGQWKLGGLQYLCPFKELTSSYLKHARIHRYDKAVDPSEASYETLTKVDQYAFAALVDEVFKGKKDDEVPHLQEFKRYCQDFLQHKDPVKRPSLSQVLHHDFFNHEFITIYKFLTFLPLKQEEEKQNFFSNILANLRRFDEDTVAKQLSGLLLSRLTMLDATARKDVIPFIFKPRNGRTQYEDDLGFFSLGVFKEHIKPRLLQLFGVKDTQIRMSLLLHFSKFVHVFSHDELSQHILPEVLLGIKDTDDSLVASTLICLSELVPILGADTVIGGKRSKLFTDGRPTSSNILSTSLHKHGKVLPSKSLKELSCSEEIYHDSISMNKSAMLHERPSPVGGESLESEHRDVSVGPKRDSETDDDWGDWDNSGRQLVMVDPSIDREEVEELSEEIPLNNITELKRDVETNNTDTKKSSIMQEAALQAKKNILDISELDIKSQKYSHSKGGEYDFFADMTPVIEKPVVVALPAAEISSKLSFVPDSTSEETGDWEQNWND